MVKQIKSDMVKAMKEKNIVVRDILRVVTGELQRNFITDGAEVIKTIKKMVQNIKEIGGSQEEIEILSKYLPKQMTNDDMIGHVRVFIEDNSLSKPSDMGRVMGFFKKNFDGLYDGKELSTIVKKLLS